MNCRDGANAIDAALILQASVGLLAELPCPEAADVNADGLSNAVDATLILQLAVGLLDTLPAAGSAGSLRLLRTLW